jgi:hypothetical protein
MDSEFHLRATASASGDATHHPSPSPRIKPPPQTASISAPFSYTPSDDGTDENLLVLLHGLGSHRPLLLLYFSQDGRDDLKNPTRPDFFFFPAGRFFFFFFFLNECVCYSIEQFLGDTHVPFSKLGRSFKLPQTATLALRAPEQYVTSHDNPSSLSMI